MCDLRLLAFDRRLTGGCSLSPSRRRVHHNVLVWVKGEGKGILLSLLSAEISHFIDSQQPHTCDFASTTSPPVL